MILLDESFSGSQFDSRLRWHSPPKSAHLSPTGLTLETAASSDFWQRTHYGFRVDSGHALLLPVAIEAGEDAGSPRGEPAALVARGTILVIDDEDTVLAIAARMLEVLGYRVLLARDGRQGLEMYGQNRAEITGVLMDLTMPHLDGEETYRELRGVDPQVRVLLMSGYNEQEAVARFVGKGLAGFIQKPFSIEDLKTSLRSILS